MVVDLVLGAIFMTAIICFTLYKIHKNSKKHPEEYLTKKEKEKIKKDILDNKEPTIGFQYKKETKILRREDKEDDKD